MNECILVTGGSGKFGRVLVRHFAAQGRYVGFTSRSGARIDEVRAALGQAAEFVVGVEADLRDSATLQALPEALAARGCMVRGLVNNARALETLRVDAAGVTARADFLAEFELNAVVPYELTLQFAGNPQHRLRSVVNIGSQYGVVAPNPALYEGTLRTSPIQYGVSKAALSHVTKELAVRLAPQGVRVNCVAFGGVEGRVDMGFKQRYAALTPARRMLEEKEIVGPVQFLLDDASSAVNGQTLVADGGWTLW